MNSYNTRFRQKWVGRRPMKKNVSKATGRDVEEHWERLAGVCAPIAGDTLSSLEQRLTTLPNAHLCRQP